MIAIVYDGYNSTFIRGGGYLRHGAAELRVVHFPWRQRAD